MRKVSVKQTGRLARYYPIRAQWLKENPNCAICTHPATEIHHKKYRHGSLLFDTRWFMSICRRCHRLVHGHIAWSKKFGYILSR